MDNNFEADNILCMHVIPAGGNGERGDITVLTVFEDGSAPNVFSGFGLRQPAAQALVSAYRRSVHTKSFIENSLGQVLIAGPSWSVEREIEVYNQILENLDNTSTSTLAEFALSPQQTLDSDFDFYTFDLPSEPADPIGLLEGYD